MKYGIQVKIWNPQKSEYVWLWVHPVGGTRYEYEDADKAHRMKEMCYPQSTNDWVKVSVINDSAEKITNSSQDN